jgi:hypothetical protein
LYFDTDSKRFYHDHHNGKVKRTKIRMRNYVESNLTFLEIKKKILTPNRKLNLSVYLVLQYNKYKDNQYSTQT